MPQASRSLQLRNSPLADAGEQLKVLHSLPTEYPFAEYVQKQYPDGLVAEALDILQVNVGRLCNMTCNHCHVDAGPGRREIMDRETVDQCLAALQHPEIGTLDLTGGAPEMNPHFRHFVRQARRMGKHVIDRCNLTILMSPGYESMASFLAEHQVEIAASLPCYTAGNTDQQRGDGAFEQSIRALQRLNGLGYGKPASDRLLTLVYNPVGASLPPNQKQLEQQYREHLRQAHGIEFNRLFTITNMPISRFLDELVQSQSCHGYMQTLVDAYNPAALPGVMCRRTISVGWDGRLFDCDFNQILDMSVAADCPAHIRDFDVQRLARRRIMTDSHCFGCTAAAGSGCQGAIDPGVG